MSNLWRRSLLVFSFAAAMLFASAASAQQECNQCDPWNSYCSDPCAVCIQFGMDGCVLYDWSTCGDAWGACLDGTCSPNWVETSRTNVGTYDGRSWNGCTHHRVDSVTIEDANECNINSYFWTRTYCDDWIDDYKSGCCYPSCCEGVGENNTQLECNGFHSCS